MIDEVCKNYFYVIECDGKVIVCCVLKLCGNVLDAYEVAAFAVFLEYRRGGRGDVLLEYVENYVCEMFVMLCFFLFMICIVDWFV